MSGKKTQGKKVDSEYGLNRYWINLGRSLLTANAVDSLMEQEDGAEYVALYLKMLSVYEERQEQIFTDMYAIFDEKEIKASCKYFSDDIITGAFKAYCKLGLIMLKERCDIGTGVWLRTYYGEGK
jgi:hypothetical protein